MNDQKELARFLNEFYYMKIEAERLRLYYRKSPWKRKFYYWSGYFMALRCVGVLIKTFLVYDKGYPDLTQRLTERKTFDFKFPKKP